MNLFFMNLFINKQKEFLLEFLYFFLSIVEVGGMNIGLLLRKGSKFDLP